MSISFESHDAVVSAFRCGMDAVLNLEIDNRTNAALRNLRVAIGVDNELAQRITVLDTQLIGEEISGPPPGLSNIRVMIPRLNLLPGRYRLTFYATLNGIIADWLKDAAVFDVEPGDYFGTGHLPPSGQGLFLIDHKFLARDDRPKFADAKIAASEC
jgi:lipopolysaccharide transport system ATP-binding protein